MTQPRIDCGWTTGARSNRLTREDKEAYGNDYG